MSNRLSRVFCAAWLGASLVACGSMQEGETPVSAGDDSDIQSALARIQGARVVGSDDGVPYAVQGRLGRAAPVQGLLARSAGVDVREALGLVAPV
ncbi:MAG TPA: peptidase M4, partial [Archangium sp.]|nr:peptidase M4 [Archangium sp.]